MALRSGFLSHCHCWAFKNTCRAEPRTTIQNTEVMFVLQETFSPFTTHYFPLCATPNRNSLQLKRVGRCPESECNPLKALKKTFTRNSVTKGGGFKLAVGFMSWDLNVKIKRFSLMQSGVVCNQAADQSRLQKSIKSTYSFIWLIETWGFKVFRPYFKISTRVRVPVHFLPVRPPHRGS